MQGASIVGNAHRKPLEALSELVEMRCGPSVNLRPICRLITHQVIENNLCFDTVVPSKIVLIMLYTTLSVDINHLIYNM